MYDHGMHEELVFWNAYCEFENKRFISNKTRPPTTDSRGSWWKPGRLFTMFSNKSSYSIAVEQKREFWEFRMSHTAITAVFVLAADIALFLVVLPVILSISLNFSREKHASISNDLWEVATSIHCALWLLPAFVVLIYLGAVIYSSKHPQLKFPVDLFQLSDTLPRIIVFFRLTMLIFEGLNQYLGPQPRQPQYCFGGYATDATSIAATMTPSLMLGELDGSTSRSGYPMGYLLFNYTQVIAFSSVPFQWWFIAGLAGVECSKLALHISTCVFASHQLSYSQILVGGSIQLMWNIVVIALVSALIMERHLIASFRNLQAQQQALMDKKILVNMLCKDIKIPTQQMMHSMNEIQATLFKNGLTKRDQEFWNSLRVHLSKASSTATVLKEIVDDLLFLVRVKEHRFEFQCIDRINLKSMTIAVWLQLQQVLQLFHMPDELSIDIEIEPSMTRINSSHQCLKLLLYHSCMSLLALLSNSNLDRLKQMFKSQSGYKQSFILFSFRCRQPAAGTHLLCCAIKLHPLLQEVIRANQRTCRRENLSMRSPRVELDGVPSSHGWFEASCEICNKLAEAVSGSWDINEQRVLFECAFVSVPSRTLTALNSSSLDNGIDSFRQPSTLTWKDSALRKALRDCIQYNVFVYLTERSSGVLLKEVMSKLPGGANLSVYDRINGPEMKIYRIALVQSVEGYQEIISKNFTGEVVLISERLTYMDERHLNMFSFGLPLPCTDRELDGFCLYLLQLNERTDKQIADLQKVASDSRLDKALASPTVSTNTSLTTDVAQLHSNEVFAVSDQLIGCVPIRSSEQSLWNPRMFALDSILQERWSSYVRWKTLNPGIRKGNVFHHTMLNPYAYFCGVLFLCTNFLWGNVDIRFCVFVVINWALIMLIMYSDVLWSTPNQNRFLMFQHILVAWNLFSFFMNASQDYYCFTKTQPDIVKPPPENFPLPSFLETSYGTMSGQEMVFFIIFFPGLFKVTSEAMPWPWGIIDGGLKSIRVFFLIIRFLFPIMKDPVQFILLMLFSLVIIAIFAYLLLREQLARQEFNLLYDMVMAERFRDSLLIVTRFLMHIPLHDLQQIELSFTNQILSACSEEKVLITPKLLFPINCLERSALISREMLIQLNTIHTVFMPSQELKTLLISSMKANLISDSIRCVCRLFNEELHPKFFDNNSLSSNRSIQFLLQMDPALMMVRCDAQLLEASLCNACRVAIQGIDESIRQNSCLRGITHEIVIMVEPFITDDAESKSMKFTDLRAMVITVLDTGCFQMETNEDRSTPFSELKQLPHQPVRPSARQGFHMSDRAMSQVNVSLCFHKGRVTNHARYRSFQRFGIPYLLCPDSHKYQTCFEESRGSLTTLNDSREQDWMKYIDSFGGLPRNFTWTNNNFSKLLKQSDTRTFNRQLGIFLYYHKDVLQKFNKYNEAFKQEGWRDCKMFNIGQLPNPSSVLHLDCLILDIAIGWQNRRRILYYQAGNTQGQLKNVDTQLESEMRQAIMIANEMLHYLRCIQYKGIVIMAHDHYNQFNLLSTLTICDDDFPDDSRSVAESIMMPNHNPFAHAVQVDGHIRFPLTDEESKFVSKLCETKILRNLLGIR
jgi:hypothetical protein